MPPVVTGEATVGFSMEKWQYKNITYKYPPGLDLRPDKNLHKKLLGRLVQFGKASAINMSSRHKDWHTIDDTLSAYTFLTDEELRISKEDPRKPISIVFPYSYAILETLVSYMVAAFTPDPIFRYEGVGPEDIGGAFLMEKLISQHCSRTKVALNLHTMFRDAGAYGIGIVSPQWDIVYGKKMVKQPTGYADALGNISQTGHEISVIDTMLFEGNCLKNVDPYKYLPDPTVPIHDVQAGEYAGWIEPTNLMDLLTLENNDEEVFNVKYLSKYSHNVSNIFDSGHSRGRGRNRLDSRDIQVRQMTIPVDVMHMYVKLIPSAWGLGKSEVPEKWLFSVAGDKFIIRAKPLGLNHNMFPIALCAPDFDGYSPLAYSRLEVLQGMQLVVNWLFNSHIANVRKAVNDRLIIDPSLISVTDLENSIPGGFIRLRKSAWGKGSIDMAVKQLAISDITQQNMGDVAAIIGYMQQVSGVDNPVMGSLRTGGPERLTGAEYKGTAQGAISRLERIAKVIGVQAMQDIGYMFAHDTQQLMSQETYLKSVGDWPEEIMSSFGVDRNRVKVAPEDIVADYDLIVRDGSIPGGNFPPVWMQLFEIIAKDPELRQVFSLPAIFDYIAVNNGAKNVEGFKIPTQATQVPQAPQAPVERVVMPDQMVQNGLSNGSLYPIG